VGTIPYADPTNSGEWAKDLLTELNDPLTATNVGYWEAWIPLESPSGYGYNPVGTKEGAPNSINANSAGVQAYTSWGEGLAATVATLVTYAGNSQLLALFKKGNATLPELSAAQTHGSWATGGESSISALGTSQPFSYGGKYGEVKDAAGIAGSSSSSSTGVLGDVFNTLKLPGLLAGASANAAATVASGVAGGIAKDAAGSIFGPLVKWIEEGAADVTFVGFGLLLVVVGLVVTFKGGTSIDVNAAPSPSGGTKEAGGIAKDAAVAAVA